jgi:hypothetical protein
MAGSLGCNERTLDAYHDKLIEIVLLEAQDLLE